MKQVNMHFIIFLISFGIVKMECPAGIFQFVNISKLLGYPELRQTVSDSLRDCGAECTGTPGCLSFGYQTNYRTCYLYAIRVWEGLELHSTTLPIVHYWKVNETCSGNGHYNPYYKLCGRFFPGEIMPWDTARMFCENQGGVLFMMDTSEKETFLKGHLQIHGFAKDVCVGTTDINNEGTWNWLNGNKVNNFELGVSNGNHCGVIRDNIHLVKNKCISECLPMCEFPTSPGETV